MAVLHCASLELTGTQSSLPESPLQEEESWAHPIFTGSYPNTIQTQSFQLMKDEIVSVFNAPPMTILQYFETNRNQVKALCV